MRSHTVKAQTDNMLCLLSVTWTDARIFPSWGRGIRRWIPHYFSTEAVRQRGSTWDALTALHLSRESKWENFANFPFYVQFAPCYVLHDGTNSEYISIVFKEDVFMTTYETKMEKELDLTAKGNVLKINRSTIHDGPGIRTTVFMKGCPLRCLWCQNPESWSYAPVLMFEEKLCTSCGNCVKACPQGCHVLTGDRHHIHHDSLQVRSLR